MISKELSLFVQIPLVDPRFHPLKFFFFFHFCFLKEFVLFFFWECFIFGVGDDFF